MWEREFDDDDGATADDTPVPNEDDGSGEDDSVPGVVGDGFDGADLEGEGADDDAVPGAVEGNGAGARFAKGDLLCAAVAVVLAAGSNSPLLW